MVTAIIQRPDTRERSEGEFLTEVEHALAATFSDDALLDVAARPLIVAPSAKRARARLAHLLGAAFDLEHARILDVAITLELVHAASLLHDDVLDAAVVRRGVPTANHLHGDVVAVLAGDLVLTRAMQRVLPLGTDVGLAVVDIVAEMSRAVALEVASRGAVLERSTWMAMAEGKTGALFGGVARLIGLACGVPDQAAVYERALRQLGVAFQAADDLLDMADDANETPFVDLRDGNPSIAITSACELDPALAAELAVAWRERADVGVWVKRVLSTGARTQVARLIVRQVDEARRLLVRELRHPRRGKAAARLLTWAEGLVRVATDFGVGEVIGEPSAIEEHAS